MPKTPLWDSPQFRRIDNEFDTAEIAALLEKHQLRHLKVSGRGRHLVVYDEYQGEKMPRVRFTRIGQERDQLAWPTTAASGSLLRSLAASANCSIHLYGN